jgi:uncharacterized protein with ATP-grasp and redox domains
MELIMTKINKPQIKIVNCSTGEEIIRDATNEEIAQLEINSANAKKCAAKPKPKQKRLNAKLY